MASKQKKPVEVIVFNDPAKRKKRVHTEQPEKDKKTKKRDDGPSHSQRKHFVFDQKKAKYEIRKLGIHGMEKKEKEDAMVDLLVELGAKPPKNRRYHIQEYQKMMKEKREEERKREEMERKAGIQLKKKTTKRKRNKDDILNYVDGQAGFYKDGVQFIKQLKR